MIVKILEYDIVHCLVTQSCVTVCNLLDCGPPGSSVLGISQAGMLEWFAISYSKGSSQPRVQIRVFCIAGGLFTIESLGQFHNESMR